MDHTGLHKVLFERILELVARLLIKLHVQDANWLLHLIKLNIARRGLLVDVVEFLDGAVDDRIGVEACLGKGNVDPVD